MLVYFSLYLFLWLMIMYNKYILIDARLIEAYNLMLDIHIYIYISQERRVLKQYRSQEKRKVLVDQQRLTLILKLDLLLTRLVNKKKRISVIFFIFYHRW